ncbi:hypothetical protein JK164_08005 [Gluconobacter kondonii]|uniref:hypothetical protein n=1 Tax=Gluconobacter kondonii TaxID=941463 RepID=UPI001B8CAE25|nr:hypothetical protein [Gluconobacter kondonii]MBS1065901.1 hypothetical protein [Gluconobacter kondonii]
MSENLTREGLIWKVARALANAEDVSIDGNVASAMGRGRTDAKPDMIRKIIREAIEIVDGKVDASDGHSPYIAGESDFLEE